MLISSALRMLKNHERIFPMIYFQWINLCKGVARMEDDKKIETAEEAKLKARRKFLKTAGKVAVTAPAVALLLNATTKPAKAQVVSGDPG